MGSTGDAALHLRLQLSTHCSLDKLATPESLPISAFSLLSSKLIQISHIVTLLAPFSIFLPYLTVSQLALDMPRTYPKNYQRDNTRVLEGSVSRTIGDTRTGQRASWNSPYCPASSPHCPVNRHRARHLELTLCIAVLPAEVNSWSLVAND
jgi:hypothetical protein